MSFTVQGRSAVVSFCRDAYPSRMTAAFRSYLNCRASTLLSSGPAVCSSLTFSTATGAFTCALDFLVVPFLEGCDLVLGLDWQATLGSQGVDLSAYVPLYAGDTSGAWFVSVTRPFLTLLLGFLPPSLPSYYSLPPIAFDQPACSVVIAGRTVDSAEPSLSPDKSYSYNYYLYSNSRESLSSQGSLAVSMSVLPPVVCQDMKSGCDFLGELLLSTSQSGITASPFSAKLDCLQRALSLHGICSYGFSLSDCQAVLIDHIFSGQCVSCVSVAGDFSGCLCFRRGFASDVEMSSAAFNILANATALQRSSDDLFKIFRWLNIRTDFRPGHFRSQSVNELRHQASHFLQSLPLWFTRYG